VIKKEEKEKKEKNETQKKPLSKNPLYGCNINFVVLRGNALRFGGLPVSRYAGTGKFI
tara:strand:- start:829 stop:1002 length:174 start_codon:yes stop_codon:yes gene_type:complete